MDELVQKSYSLEMYLFGTNPLTWFLMRNDCDLVGFIRDRCILCSLMCNYVPVTVSGVPMSKHWDINIHWESAFLQQVGDM